MNHDEPPNRHAIARVQRFRNAETTLVPGNAETTLVPGNAETTLVPGNAETTLVPKHA